MPQNCNRIVILMAISTLHLSHAQLRILEGNDLSTHKRYMAYFSKANQSNRKYDAWVCGGAIVTMQHIVTSAACLHDVKKMYAIAGYNKYVPPPEIDKDPCTSVSKKPVIQTCLPINYNFDFVQASKWSDADIGIARIKGQFDFNNVIDKCSYAPGAIAINYRSTWQAEGMHALVMGWGHNDTWRDTSDTKDYNSKTLKFAKVKIVNKQKCVEAYSNVEGLAPVITKFMICTHGPGKMNETGDLEEPESFEREEEHPDGCALRDANGRCLKLRQAEENPAEPEIDPAEAPEEIPTEDPEINPTEDLEKNPKENPEKHPTDDPEKIPTKKPKNNARSGICQNDHGGPLVTFVGRAERLIGIASVFLINEEDRKCQGPFMYTSTFCNQQFLRCFFGNISNSALLRRNGDPESSFDERYLDMQEEESRRFYLDVCLQPPALRGFDIEERIISWSNNDFDEDNTKNDELETRTNAKSSTNSPVHTSSWSPARPPIRPLTRRHIRSPNRSRSGPPTESPTWPTTTAYNYLGFSHRNQIPIGNFG